MSALAIESILKGRRSQPQQLIEVLQDIQEQHGFIAEDNMRQVSAELGVPLIEVYRVANFYKAFSLKPLGKYVITICAGTACHVRGAQLLANQVLGQLGLSPGDTTEDGLFSFEQVNCLGACALGPVVVVSCGGDQTYYSHMTPGKLRKLIDTLAKEGKEAATDVKRKRTEKAVKAAKN